MHRTYRTFTLAGKLPSSQRAYPRAPVTTTRLGQVHVTQQGVHALGPHDGSAVSLGGVLAAPL